MVLDKSLYWGILPKTLCINRRLGKNFGEGAALRTGHLPPTNIYNFDEGPAHPLVELQAIAWSGKFVGAAKRENH